MRRLVLSIALLLALPASARAAELTVLAAPGTPLLAHARVPVPDAPARILRRVPELGATAVQVPDGQAGRILARLRRTRGVTSATPAARFAYRELPDDPALTEAEPQPGTEPGTVLEWWALKENLPAAWDLSKGGGIRVAVIDSGVDAGHAELRSKISSAVDVETIPGRARQDTVGHGTHVSSLACGATGNGVGIAGAGHDCRLIAIKTDLSDLSVAAGLVEAVRRHAQVVNMSFGAPGRRRVPPILRRALDYTLAHDVVMVAAAADAPLTQQGDPASVLQPTGTGSDLTRGRGLVVTAATVADQRASFAGRGSQISLAAYGAYHSDPSTQGGPPGILAAFPRNRTSITEGTNQFEPCGCRVTFKGDPGYAYLAGTSMAAPQVAGIAALVRAANRRLTALQVIRIIKQTARRSGGWSPDVGWGIVDAAAAVALAQATPGTRTSDA